MLGPRGGSGSPHRRNQHPQRFIRRNVPRRRTLHPNPEFLAIDGNRFRTHLDLPYRCIVKGDATYADIAAASVLAKTHRDEFMRDAAARYPGYNWEINKGYPTRDHREAIAAIGPSPIHRMTFRLLPDSEEKPTKSPKAVRAKKSGKA